MTVPLGCFPLTKKTWALNVDHPQGEDLEFFTGQISPEVIRKKYNTQKNLEQVEHLVVALGIYELGFTSNCTKWVKSCLEFLESSKIFPNLNTVYFLYHSIYFDLNEITSNFNIKKVFCNYLLLRSSLTDIATLNKNKVHNNSNKKFAMFLLGDGGRINRLPLLYEFFQNNNLSILEYSFRSEFPWYETSDAFFSRLSNQELLKYMMTEFQVKEEELKENILNLQRKISSEDFFSIFYSKGAFDSTAYYFPKEWFSATVILMMETSFYNKWDNKKLNFTEKMYKPILTKKAFITCSNQDYLYSVLEENGFKTFLEYTDYPDKISTDFNENKNLRQYSELTYKRTVNFINNSEKYKNNIQDDIEHNFERWVNICEKTWVNFLEECPPIKELDKKTISKVFIMGESAKYIEENIDRIYNSNFIALLKYKLEKA